MFLLLRHLHLIELRDKILGDRIEGFIGDAAALMGRDHIEARVLAVTAEAGAHEYCEFSLLSIGVFGAGGGV
jgi:hypothetical protein